MAWGKSRLPGQENAEDQIQGGTKVKEGTNKEVPFASAVAIGANDSLLTEGEDTYEIAQREKIGVGVNANRKTQRLTLSGESPP